MAARNYFSLLPPELLGGIHCRLSVADYVRSGAVCRSWRQATAGKPCPNAKTAPWLMFSGDGSASEEGSKDPNSLTFFSISDGKHHSFLLPQIRGKWIVGSSHGSIIADGTTNTLLLDPLTGAEVLLPPITLGDGHDPFIQNLVFSPSSSTAVAFYADCHYTNQYLSFALAGDDTWTLLQKFPGYHFCDLIIHKGEFYVLDHNGSLLSFDPASGRIVPLSSYGAHFGCYNLMYLVESLDGDHLLLVRWNSWTAETGSFEVFKQDKVGLRWVEVGSLGEVAIFVGRNYSTCIFTRGLPELRGNCVYFTDDWDDSRTWENGFYFGVFDLKNGSMEEMRGDFVLSRSEDGSVMPPFWIMPHSS